MPNGFHGQGSETVTPDPEQQRILDSAEASERAATAACERAAERDNLDAEACEFLRPYHDGTWEISQRAFSFGELSGRPAPRPASDVRVVELERQLVAKCLGEAPVYFRDQRDRAVAIVTRLVGWATDDMSAGTLAMKYRLACAPAAPAWGHPAPQGRLMAYRRA